MCCRPKEFEPSRTVRIANVWTTKLEHEAGIGPAIAVLQTASLPLADSCKIGASGGTRTPTPFLAADFESAVSANSIHRRTENWSLHNSSDRCSNRSPPTGSTTHRTSKQNLESLHGIQP